MTHLNHQTNGASLEDCHTNFFALTDLCGIKWRKLVHGEPSFFTEPLDDPVLSSFSRCLAADILCVWRRVGTSAPAPVDPGGGAGTNGIFDNIGLPPPPIKHPPLSLHAAKELWIFWYGEEPDLSGLVSPVLLGGEGEQGSWEGGLTYECRSLLFKALHNLIERCLLSRDCVRLGRFFVQPHDGPDKVPGINTYPSFSFAFFLHGESTVCTSVDVRVHPPVYSLGRHHIAQAQACNSGTPVILAPNGLAGNLTGVTFKSSDATTQRFLDEWRQFYPIHPKPGAGDGDLPAVVEVLVGGVKMKYPTGYVLATDMDDPAPANLLLPAAACPLGKPAAKLSSGPASPPCSPCPNKRKAAGGTQPAYPAESEHMTVSSAIHPASMHHPSRPSVALPEWAWQDCIHNSAVVADAAAAADPANGEPPIPAWLYSDPMRKLTCNCSKLKKGGNCKVDVGGSSSCMGVRPPRRTPFHRRREPPAPRRRCKRSSATQAANVPSYVRGQVLTPNTGTAGTAGNNNSSGSGDLPVPSVGSPGSAAPSPLPNPHSQPASLPPAEPTMPTLSPHPPATQPPTPDVSSNVNPKSVSSANPTFSPYPSGGEKPAADQVPVSTPAPETLATTPGPAVPAAVPTPTYSLKRPVLISREYECAVNDEEHQPSDLLYDYSALDAWLNHPVKKLKLDGKERKKYGADLYASHQPNRAPTPPPPPARPSSCRSDGDCDGNSGNAANKRSDPYEFDDDMNAANHDDDRKMEANGLAKGLTGNLYTSEGLTASYKDLDQIFDNSDDTSSDEPVAVPTPPNSNKPDDGTPLLVKPPRGSGGAPHVGSLRPEELSKMFPTPPSMEHNPIASPSGHLSDGQICETTDGPLFPRFKQEIYPSMGSPPEEQIEDWSYVFRPPVTFRMVGSSKYAPLTNLPSATLPALTLPTQCVYKPSWLQTASEKQPTTNKRVGPAPPSPPSPQLPCPDMPSPASTTSSYLNRNLTSIEPVVTPVTARAPEANSLVVNVLLADTALNIFRDHNFDSCTLCVCNAGIKCVGNIRGADAGYFLQTPTTETFPPSAPPPYGGMLGGADSPPLHGPHNHHEEDGIRCNCGFSAVVNRKLSHKSGLFYEDELEITGVADDGPEKSREPLPQAIVELLREQLVVVQSASNSVHRAARPRPYATYQSPSVNLLEMSDINEVTTIALEQGRLAMEAACKTDDTHSRQKTPSVHRWGYLRAHGPQCTQDIIRVMKSLQPILQEAVQKKCTTRLWEAPYTVSGPLTWRQFHRLAGRGTDDRCEPQPIPSVLVGYEKDWVSLSPYSLQLWDKLNLEPYSYTRDVAYIVVAPENDFVLSNVRMFFKELSSTYESCRLGRHVPITKVLRDGILRVGRAAATKLSKEPIDDWFSQLGDSPLGSLLKLYAQACKYHLAPHLSQITVDRSLLDPPEGVVKLERPAPSPMPPPSSVGSDSMGDKAPSTPKPDLSDLDVSQSSIAVSATEFSHDDDDADPPSVVLYLVDPFTMNQDDPEKQRTSCIALLRSFTIILNAVPEAMRNNLTIQILSLESILELRRARDIIRHNDHMRSLALSVFSQCRRQLVHTAGVKSLTGFGTAAMAEMFLKSKNEKNKEPYRLYSPPYILAPHRDKVESPESFGKPSPTPGGVLYVSYCLSADQRFLLTVLTDETGSIFESTVINIEIPNRSRRKKASARRIGLQKLMDFILGVISLSVQPWRLVVGRVGRIGHGELKGWSWLLSRKSLLKASKHLREICNQCSLLPTTDVPSILSACLVSLEPDSALRVMPDQFTPDERFSQTSVNCQLSTPQDVTCTHILVFPTSARTQSSQTAFNEQHINGPDLGDDDIFSALEDEAVAEGIDGMQDELNDIFSTWPGGPQSPSASPRRNDSMSQQGSPGDCGLEAAMDQQNPLCSVPSRNGGAGDPSEDVGTLLQQPLALGYFVSTAPTGPMPNWFWASCPHLENVCPVFLKHALHMHSPNVQQSSEDILQQQTAVTVHALDSQYTTDVLRYVLEGYNALSWLAMDSNTRDRLSCLPVHIQVLMQLYHMTASLI